MLLATTLLFAIVYHFLLPRVWLSHTKVVLGLLVDVALTTEVVRLTGYHMSLLVFLYYLIIIACALTLETRTLYGICAVISVAFCAVLPFDPLFLAAPRATPATCSSSSSRSGGWASSAPPGPHRSRARSAG